MSGRGHAAALAALGLEGAERAALVGYLDLLAEWSARVNLTGARSAEERVGLLVAPVLPARAWVKGPRLLDVGSGNGSPGLVLGLLRPELELVLLEPRLKRWAFLREALRRAPRRGPAEVRRERHDAYPGPPASTVSRRAVALGPPELAGLLEPGGRLLIFGPAAPAPAGWTAQVPAPGLQVLQAPGP